MYYRIQSEPQFNVDTKSSHHSTPINVHVDDVDDFMSESEGECEFCGCHRIDKDVCDEYMTPRGTDEYDIEVVDVCYCFDGVCCCEDLDDLFSYIAGMYEELYVVAFEGQYVDSVFDGEVIKPTSVNWIKPAEEVWEE